jgi:hypothetical protein
MSDTKKPLAPIPVALIDDCVTMLASATHTQFTFGQVANVVQALNHFKGQAAREDGNQPGDSAPMESDTSGPAPA